jgi:hypothetical protein
VKPWYSNGQTKARKLISRRGRGERREKNRECWNDGRMEKEEDRIPQ